jgi:hypothetical protein
MMVYADSHMLVYVLNLLCVLRKLQLVRYVIFWALDSDMFDVLGRQDSVVVYYDAKISVAGNPLRHSSPAFYTLTKLKFQMLAAIIHLEYDVFFCDADTVWICDPLQHISTDADLIVTRDVTKKAAMKDPETINPKCPLVGTRTPNSGVMFLRANSRTKVMLASLQARARSKYHQNHNDQIVLWKYIVNSELTCLRDCVEVCDTSRVSVRFLPPALWPNTNMLFSGAPHLPGWIAEHNRTRPILVHLNGGKSGSNSKQNRLKSFGWWFLDDQRACAKKESLRCE